MGGVRRIDKKTSLLLLIERPSKLGNGVGPFSHRSSLLYLDRLENRMFSVVARIGQFCLSVTINVKVTPRDVRESRLTCERTTNNNTAVWLEVDG